MKTTSVTFHKVKVSTSWDSQNSQQVTLQKCPAQLKKPQRYARIVASYLSAEKQHTKTIRTMTELGRRLWSHHSSRESTAAVVPLCSRRGSDRRNGDTSSSFHQDGRVLPSPACPWTALWAPRTLMTTFLFPAVFQEEPEKELRSESEIKGGTQMWLERPPLDGGCQQHAAVFSLPPHCSTLTLEDGGLQQWSRWSLRSVCLPLSIHESGNTSVCDESEPDVLVKVGQTPFNTLNVTVSSRASSAKRLFFLHKRLRVTVWQEGGSGL